MGERKLTTVSAVKAVAAAQTPGGVFSVRWDQRWVNWPCSPNTWRPQDCWRAGSRAAP